MNASDFDIILRPYQQETSININNIFYSDTEYNRFAAAVVPTGGGKSFIGIDQMISINNDKGQRSNLSEYIVNDSKIAYIAPGKEILSQIKLHIVRNLFLNMINLENMTIDEINQSIQGIFDDINKGIKQKSKKIKFTPITKMDDTATVNEKKSAIIENLDASQIDRLVQMVFPNLILKCYAGIKENDEEKTVQEDISVKPNEETILEFTETILDTIDLDNMTISQINQSIQKKLKKYNSKKKTEYSKLKFDLITGIDDNASAEEKKKAILENLYHNAQEYGEVDDELMVRESDIADCDLIIIDEAHRVGATSWGKEVQAGIEKNKKAKILAITATPERVDKKGQRDMMYGIAKMIYPDNVPLPDKYMAQEIYLLDAMRDGLVTTTDVVTFNSSLANSEEYWELVSILKKFEEKRERGPEKEKVVAALEKMEEIIGYSPRSISNEELEARRQEDIRQTIAKNLKNKNGKYIAFIPSKAYLKAKTSTQNFKEWEKIIKSQFEGIVDPDLITIEYVSSDKTDKENDETLKRFEDAPNDRGGIKILMSVGKLDEGVHVEGIDGEFMYKKVNSTRLYFQESGRCITSCDPNLPSERQSRRKIFDIVGNTRTQIEKRAGQQTSHKYNLGKIIEISEWIKANGRYPDIDLQISKGATDAQKVVFEKEIRYAITLKNLKSKYQIYKTEELPIEDKAIIEEILQTADEIKLWELETKNRTEEPSEEQLTGSKFLSYSEQEAEFMEAYNSAKYAGGHNKLNNSIRFARVINILKILKMHKPDIVLPEGILGKNSKNEIKRTENLRKKVDFETFLKENFSEFEVQVIIRELGDYDLLGASSSKELYNKGEEIDLATELAFARGYFWTSENLLEDEDAEIKALSRYSLKDMIRLGLINVNSKEQQEDMFKMFGVKFNEIFDRNGYIRPSSEYAVRDSAPLYKKFGISSRFRRGSFTHGGEEYVGGYDRDGYDEEGYDKLGFNKFGFNKDKIHKDTGTKYNLRGFYYDENEGKWINRRTHTEYDLLGYNIYDKNEDGFGRPGSPPNVKALWYKRFEDGTYSKNGIEFSSITDENSIGYTKEQIKRNEKNLEGFYPNGTTLPDLSYVENVQFEDYLSEEGFDINGYNKYGFKKVIVNGKERYIHRDTSMEFNKEGMVYDKKSNSLKLAPVFSSTQAILTNMIVKNKSIDEIAVYYKQTNPIFKNKSEEEIKEQLRNTIERGISNSKMAVNFDLYTNNRTGRSYFMNIDKCPEKAKKFQEFFQFCPMAKKALTQETKEIKRRLDIVNGVMSLNKRQVAIANNLSEIDSILEKE